MNWPQVQLKKIFDIARGGSPRPIEKYITEDADGINWISIGDASESSKYIYKTKRRIDRSGLSKSRLVSDGDLLLTNSMSFGRPYIMRTSGCIHDGWLVLAPKMPVDPDFFYHILGSSDIYRKFSQLAAGATVKNLNIDLVKDVAVQLPPLDEQRRIAAILDQTDDLRRKRRAALDRLDELAPASFTEDYGDPIQNPLGFTQVPLEQVIDPKRPITYGILMPGPHLEDGVPYVRVVDIQDGTVVVDGLRKTSATIIDQYKRSELKSGDVLISIRGHVGRLAIVPRELDGANVTQDTARLAVATAEPTFIKSLLETPQAKNWMDRRTKGAAVKGLNLGDLRQLPVILPPINQQRTFAARIVEIDRLKAHHRTHLAKLDSLFASLQHRAFRGEL